MKHNKLDTNNPVCQIRDRISRSYLRYLRNLEMDNYLLASRHNLHALVDHGNSISDCLNRQSAHSHHLDDSSNMFAKASRNDRIANRAVRACTVGTYAARSPPPPP